MTPPYDPAITTEPLDATLRGEGVRAPWSTLPEEVVDALADLLGSPVVSASDRAGGFSPGPAAVLALADGRSVFAKAASHEGGAGNPRVHRREAVVAAALPASVPAPRLLGWFDRAGWVVLAFEAVDGGPAPLPWRDDELERFLAVAERVAAVDGRGIAGLRGAPAVVGPLFRCWSDLDVKGTDGLDPWSVRHLDLLRSCATEAERACAGAALVHGDLRGDNVVFERSGGAAVVDWPSACVGAPWLDLALSAPAIAMQGGPDPESLVARSRLLATAPVDDLTSVVVAAAGYFTAQALEPPPPGLPTVRRFQHAQGVVARRWAATRLGLAPP